MTTAPALVARPTAALPARSPWAVLRSVVFALYLRELKTRLGGRWWGALWVLGEPLANLALMLVIYGMLRAHSLGGIDTILFLVTGLLPYQLFKSLVLRCMESIDANQGLFAYRQVRPVDAVLSRACVEISMGGVLLVVTVLALLWSGHWSLPADLLGLLACSVELIGLGSALGLLLAAATGGVLARSRVIVRVAFLPVYLVSGVIMPLSALPASVREPLMLNPLAHLMDGLRRAYFGEIYHAMPETDLAVPLVWWLVSAVLALALYRYRRDKLQSV